MAPKATRPSLTSLTDRMAKKETAPTAAQAAEPMVVGPADKKDGRVQVLVRMTPVERKALRQIALDQDTTVQALVEESIRDLLSRHGIKTA